MFQLPYIGPDTLPEGWHRPTRGLVEYAQLLRSEGFAPSYARPLYLEAAEVTSTNLQEAQRRMTLLERYVTVTSDSALSALGVADPQQLAAQRGALRIFSMLVGMPNLKADSRALGRPMAFINPHFEPVKASKLVRGSKLVKNIETCLSFPGIAVTVEYFDKGHLISDNHPTLLLKGPEAEVAQHELGHINGVPHILRAIGPMRYVPREVHRLFYDEYVAKKRIAKWPLTFLAAQLEATMDGRYRLSDYERYLNCL